MSTPASSLLGRKILLGVCGSIAAYKAALVVRLLVKVGAEVQVVLTPSALAFVTPLTLSTLSKKPVLQGFLKDEVAGEWHNHVHLGLWADALVVAPASANTLGHLANGLCDTLLDAVYLSARCPVFVAPAMDLDMYQHPATQANLRHLRQYGTTVWDSPAGELASGLSGPGRMLEPEAIVASLEDFFQEKKEQQ
ncbi:flavoprotein [Hymenobacter mucosus]|uniref:Phosphopantothenoylcysteine decarboxylase / phosphopantothenate--cysteine ligase n=1 Tax=Hymenobacter mucosus TaxID=1411120 RepID=A0A238YIC9_9BACT|nr:flavoprotein [Hymenobacter mucosus]SNR70732.1 phosphopantothenoylcysteine decarboxylase / phosphopantothenate--cysteine ligase [Hymenobacter mucosus]